MITLAADPAFTKPDIAYGKLSPMLIVFGVALVGVLVEAFVAAQAPLRRPDRARAASGCSPRLAAVVLLATGVLDGGANDKFDHTIEAMGAISVDGPSLFIWGTLLVFSIISVMLFAERRLEGGVTAFAGQAAALPGTEAEREASSKGIEHTEVFPLVMFAIGGMMLFASANDLLTMFVALEVFSLPLYLLCGLARRRRLISQEAAMKYFLLGAFSSAFFLYGIALIYGYAGSLRARRHRRRRVVRGSVPTGCCWPASA